MVVMYGQDVCTASLNGDRIRKTSCNGNDALDAVLEVTPALRKKLHSIKHRYRLPSLIETLHFMADKMSPQSKDRISEEIEEEMEKNFSAIEYGNVPKRARPTHEEI